MAAPSIRPLVDRLLGGHLDTFIIERRKAGQSFNAIAAAIHKQADVVVTAETIRQWSHSPGHGERRHADGERHS